MAQQELTAASPALDRRAFIGKLERTAEAAAQAAGGFQDRDFAIADESIRLCFAGPALTPVIVPALAHLQSDLPGDPSLTVRVWDSLSTRTPMPPAPWRLDDYRQLGAIRGYFDEQIQAVYQLDSQSLTLVDPERASALFWTSSPGSVPFNERSSPLRTLLHLWLSHRGLQFAHAAALGYPNGCVLLPGRGGAGKSSSALACLGSDLGYLADDFCVLEPGQPPLIHALYSSAKAHLESFERLGLPTSLIANRVTEPTEKAVSFLHEHMPEKLLARAPLRAVLVPRITGERDTVVRPGSQAAALAALAPSSILMLPGSSAYSLQRLAGVVRTVPCYELAVGTDPDQIPRAIARVLGR